MPPPEDKSQLEYSPEFKSYIQSKGWNESNLTRAQINSLPPDLKAEHDKKSPLRAQSMLKFGAAIDPQNTLAQPLVDLSAAVPKGHPLLEGVAQGVSGFTSPKSLALIFGSAGGIGAIAKTPEGAATLSRLISAGFSADMIKGLYDQSKDFRAAIDAKDYDAAQRIAGRMAVGTAGVALASGHALRGDAVAPGEVKTIPVEDSNPINRVVSEPPPDVRLVANEIAKQQVEAKETPAETKTETKPTTTAPAENLIDKALAQKAEPSKTDKYSYPIVGETADGLTVGEHVANTDSISASLTDWKERPGIREVPIADFENQSISKSAKVKALADKITDSGRIDPAIVVIDKDGPYILEGGNRFDALKLLGKKSIPALVVDDLESQGAAKESEAEPQSYGPLEALASEARKASSFDEFESNFSREIKHGQYWHITDDPNFTIDPAKGPRDMSSLANGEMEPGKLMITSHLENWEAEYPKRGYAALIDMGDVPGESYKQVNRGFGNEFYVDDPAKARVVKVVPIKDALAESESFQDALDKEISSKEDLREFYNRVTGGSSGEAQPTAKIVPENHIPVVTQDAVLAATVQRMIDNSGALQEIGVDPEKIQSREDVSKMLEDASGHIQANLDPRVGARIGFDAQKSLASDLGMDVEDLLARKSGEAWNAEKAVAARALLRDSQTRVMNLARLAAMGDEAYQTEFAKALAQHQAVTETVRGIAAETGRALGSFRIKDTDLPALKISDAFSKLDPKALSEAAKLLSKMDENDPAAVNKFIEQIRPSTTPEKIFEYYRNALLSSPHTVIVKGVSEIAMMALEATKKAVAGGLSKLKDDSPERYASESVWYGKGVLDAMRHIPAVLSGKFNLADSPDFERTGQQAIKGMLGSGIRIPSTILSKQTNVMYMLNYFGELNAQAARVAISEGLSGKELYARQEYLVQNPTDEMADAANETALHNTFQKKLGTFGSMIQGAIRRDPSGVSKYLFPFFKTPINLVKASGEFSPYGLFKGIAKGDTDLQARGLVGSSLAAGIAYLALNGKVTGGGPTDFKKKETLEATGWQPYSIKIGNKYYSYNRAEPLGLVFGLVADTVAGQRLGDPEEVTQSKADNAVSHIERNVSSLPFLFQVSSIMDALKDTSGKRVDNFIARQVGSFIPALSANIAEATDRTIRHPSGNSLGGTIAQTAEGRIPGLTRNVPAVLDATGKPAQRPASALGGANPFPVSVKGGDPVLTELARLGVSTQQPPSTIKAGKKEIPITPEEGAALAAQEGRLLYQRLQRVIQNSGWQKAPDDAKREAIKNWREELEKSRVGRLYRLRAQNEASVALGGR